MVLGVDLVQERGWIPQENCISVIVDHIIAPVIQEPVILLCSILAATIHWSAARSPDDGESGHHDSREASLPHNIRGEQR